MREEDQIKKTLEEIARHQLGNGFGSHAGPLEAFANASLLPAEALIIAGASDRRLATFRAGRHCARAALMNLGVEPVAILAEPSGAPIWPVGVVGSISHTDNLVVAVVAPSPPVGGLGIDLEGDEPIDDPGMIRIICRPEELFMSGDSLHPANRARCKLLFVIKEAVYKAHRVPRGTFLDFQDVSVSLDEEAGTFCATIVNTRMVEVVGYQSVFGSFVHSGGLFVAIASQNA